MTHRIARMPRTMGIMPLDQYIALTVWALWTVRLGSYPVRESTRDTPYWAMAEPSLVAKVAMAVRTPGQYTPVFQSP